ncbi:MAG: translocation/assembly module TamB domain-containing protein [Geobacteraceae bacterium]|nr:translocation/assembly module TamB domain-containing protein [Geobacteraceae bacterium]
MIFWHCTVGDVRAGVIVSERCRPVTRLYSEPAMPDVDVLAYIVLGRTLGSSGEQASLLAVRQVLITSSRQAGACRTRSRTKLGLVRWRRSGRSPGTAADRRTNRR